MKKVALGIGTIMAVLTMAIALVANAQASPTSSENIVSTAERAQPMVLQVGAAGRVLIRGTVVSASAGSLSINSWGGVWTINVPSSAKVYPAAANDSVTGFQTGDFVGAEGTVDANASWTINAGTVRDWTMKKTVKSQEQQNRTQARQLMNEERPRVYVGTASSIGTSSLTLTSENGNIYTVNIEAGAKILNRNWSSASISSIQSGDAVRVYGVNSSGTIAATVVRDITLK